MERLDAQEDDLYILTLPDNASGVTAHLLATESLRFYCTPSDARASLKSVSLPDVASATFVVREPGSGTRRYFRRCWRSGYELRIRAELGSDEAVAEAAAAGLGIALLPVAIAAPFVASGSLAAVRADIPNLELNWHLVHRERAALPAAALLFVREAQADRTIRPECETAEPESHALRMSVCEIARDGCPGW
jgi:DNA-binding transcriptional LysR family regulator